MPSHFSVFEVTDPHETSRRSWDNLPPHEKTPINGREVWSREYAVLDWGRLKREQEKFRSEFSVAELAACAPRVLPIVPALTAFARYSWRFVASAA
jgi:hypothetical protein